MSFSLVALSIVHTLKIYILNPDFSFELHIVFLLSMSHLHLNGKWAPGT